MRGRTVMRRIRPNRPTGSVWLLTASIVFGGSSLAWAQEAGTGSGGDAVKTAPPQASDKPTFEIYGFAMLDIGHDFKQINPNWSDTMRVTKLPSFEDEFGRDHSTFAGVRQSRLGVRSSTPTA